MLSAITTGPIPGTSIAISDLFRQHISPWMTIVSAFAVGLASVNLLRVHTRAIARKRNDWIYSVILIVTLAIYAGFRTYVELNLSNATAAANYALIFNNILTPLSAAMWALLAFYVASASYRAFRARSAEATVLLISAIVVMLGAAPVGALIWSRFPDVQRWLLEVPNMTGQRGILIGAAIGGFVTSLRVLLGMERGHLGSAD
jgi:positive regulator of sigma E activity